MTASTRLSIGWTMNGMTAKPTAVGAHLRTIGEFLTVRSTRNELSATYAYQKGMMSIEGPVDLRASQFSVPRG